MYNLKKALALLLSIVMVLGMCAFAEPVVEEQLHEHVSEETLDAAPVMMSVEETEEEAAEETTEEEVIEETEEEVVEETTEEEVVEETEEEVAEETTEEEVLEETEEEVAEETTEEEVLEETEEEEVIEETEEEVAEETTEEEAVEETEEEVVEETTEDPNAGIALLMVGDDLDIDEYCGNHVFRGSDTCIVCGFKCEHDEYCGIEQIFAGAVLYDEDLHTITYNYSLCCYVCGQELELDSSEDVEEPHEFSADGFCYMCGYETDDVCAHKNVEVMDEYEDWISSELVNSGSHKAVYQKFQSVYCKDCDTEFDRPVGKTYSKTESHKFSHDEWSFCEVCGYKCEHPTTVQQNEYWEEYDEGSGCIVGLEMVDENTHRYKKYLYVQKRCTVCSRASGYTDSSNWVWEYEGHWGAECECGYTGEEPDNGCEHQWTTEIMYDSDRDAEYTYDDSTHTMQMNAYKCTYCQKCGMQDWDNWWIDYPAGNKTVTEKHEFCTDGDGDMFFGECYYCPYVTTCAHKNMDTIESLRFVTIEQYNDKQHIVNGAEFELYICNDCGLSYESATGEMVAQKAEHTMEDNECVYCGYTPCKHPNTESKTEEVETFVATDDDHHNAVITSTTTVTCKDCSLIVGEPTVTETIRAVEDHEYSGGVCSNCKYTCGHSKKTAGEAATTYTYTSDDSTHAATVRVVTPYSCPSCMTQFSETKDELADAEVHTYAEGKCSVCEHVCAHTNIEETVEETLLGYQDICDETHSAVSTVTTTNTCPDCAYTTSNTVEVVADPAEHNYAEGVCADCKHTCSHVDKEATEEYFVAASYTKVDGSKHSATGELRVKTLCECCGLVLNDELKEAEHTLTENHSFSGRKCTKCGYTKPAPEPTVEPTVEPEATDEPTFVEVPKTEEVHGVTVSDAPTMVEAMDQVLTAIEAENKSVTIENTEKLLKPEENEKLVQLKTNEQMMVMLAVMGFETEVDAALVAAGSELSEDANALSESIQARIAAMTEEEKAAFNALILELFGAGAESDEIVFVLCIRNGSEVSFEQYTFKLVEGSWVLTGISKQP